MSSISPGATGPARARPAGAERLARRALGLALGTVGETPRWTERELSSDEILDAIEIIRLRVPPGPAMSRAVDLLTDLRDLAPATDGSAATGGRPRGDASLSIALIEGRGIWIELRGGFVRGACDGVGARFERLATLAFKTVVLDARRVDCVDAEGTELVAAFAQSLFDNGGRLFVLDPIAMFRTLADRGLPGIEVSAHRPAEPWWRG